MTISLAMAKKLARSLRRENRPNGRSWRTIAREDYRNEIDQSTLSRIAREKGKWIPATEHLQILLGLKKAHKSKPKAISEMTKDELICALRNRQPMPMPGPKIISAFRQLGWLNMKGPQS
jgi:hypothetical protein